MGGRGYIYIYIYIYIYNVPSWMKSGLSALRMFSFITPVGKVADWGD
jgi:hypothetical protein